MRLQQLNVLCALEQYHSFSKAAEHLFVSQPALSASIKALEEELQCTLLTRSKKGVEFTPVGKIALEKAHDILNEIVLVRSIAKNAEKLPEKLYIASNTLRCLNLLLRLLRQINLDNSEALINLQELSDHEIIHQLTYGTLDFALLQVNKSDSHEEDQVTLPAMEQLNVVELTAEPLVVLVRDSHPLVASGGISIRDLFLYPFVTAQKETDAQLIQSMNEMGFSKPPLEIRDTLSLDRLISQTNHWTFVPSSEISRHLQRPNNVLKSLCLKDFSCNCVIYWLSNNKKQLAEETVFLKMLQQFLHKPEKTP